MVALVTGGSGFVGSAVVRKLLERDEDVRVLVRGPAPRRNLEQLGVDVDIVVGDLRLPETLRPAMRGVKTLYHVAADYRLWAPRTREIYESNVLGTENILRIAADAGVQKIIHTSSVCTLGTNRGGTPADETTPVSIRDMIGAYKISKFQAEQCALQLAAEGAPIVIVNPSTPVGPRDTKPTPTGRMVRDAAMGKIPAFVNTGLNFVDVDDVATGHLLACDRGIIGERYILGGNNISLKSFLSLIAELTGRKPPQIALPRHAIYPIALIAEAVATISSKEPLVTVNGLRLAKKLMYFSSAKAQQELGYSFGPLQTAIRDAILWFDVDLAPNARALGAIEPACAPLVS